MNYDEEIMYRDLILSQARAGKKLTADERFWLVTHPIYNSLLGYPFLNADIVNLESNTCYRIHVKVEDLNYSNSIIPIITVPGGRGKIVTSTTLTNYKGDTIFGKSVKMLALLLDLEHSESGFEYKSDLGLLGVSYQCDYYDDKQQLMIRQSSDTGNGYFAMQRENVGSNKMLYRCKNPINHNFDSLVFSVEWEKISSKY